MGEIVTEVATRLRAGASPQQAWKLTLPGYGLTVADPVLREDGVPLALVKLWDFTWWQRWQLRISGNELVALPATFAVCRMSSRAGAPMAEILDACALTITEAGEARAAREIALAGPITSARTLALLPVAGIFLGYLLGADPVQFIFDTSLGKLVLAAGIGCELLGIGWVLRLVARAKDGELLGKARRPAVDEAVVLDLASAGLSAGMAIPDLLHAIHFALGEMKVAGQSTGKFGAGSAAADKSLREVANLLLMGAPWQRPGKMPDCGDYLVHCSPLGIVAPLHFLSWLVAHKVYGWGGHGWRAKTPNVWVPNWCCRWGYVFYLLLCCLAWCLLSAPLPAPCSSSPRLY